MTTKNKKFDCVKMKADAQAELLAEFEKRKGEFATYAMFLDAKLEESPKMKQFWDKISNLKSKASA